MQPNRIILMLFAFSSVAHAQEQTFGNWAVGVSKTGQHYAATTNDSGNVFGEYCNIQEETCVWLLGLTVKCNSGARYPILINAESGALPVEAYCSGQPVNGVSQYVFTEFDKITLMTEKNSRIGFAFPLEGDQFRVVRFDLTGATTAVNTMLSRASAVSNKRSTKDKTL